MFGPSLAKLERRARQADHFAQAAQIDEAQPARKTLAHELCERASRISRSQNPTTNGNFEAWALNDATNLRTLLRIPASLGF